VRRPAVPDRCGLRRRPRLDEPRDARLDRLGSRGRRRGARRPRVDRRRGLLLPLDREPASAHGHAERRALQRPRRASLPDPLSRALFAPTVETSISTTSSSFTFTVPPATLIG